MRLKRLNNRNERIIGVTAEPAPEGVGSSVDRAPALKPEPIRRPFLRLEGVTKRYGGVTALADVNFECSLGTIHAVVGENGAGKSSLMKIIAGVIRPDEGRIYLDNAPV